MPLYHMFCAIVLLVTLVCYANHRWFKLQNTIPIMIAGCLAAFMLMFAGQMHWLPEHFDITPSVRHLDFHDLLINGLLSYLLFAGALNLDIHTLRQCKWEVAVLALVSTLISCVLIALGMFYVLQWLGLAIHFLHCLLFGALISPTDPIAVLATFKKLNAPKKLHAMVAGESLYNDGVGVVMFITFYHLSFSGHADISSTLLLFSQQTLGGILYGAIIGFGAQWLLSPVKDYHVEILMTLSLVTAGYLLAFSLNISGPLAMVTAGLILGQQHDGHQKSPMLFQFWDILDELLNAMLFFMIGIELLNINIASHKLTASLLAVVVVLMARAISVAIPMTFFKRYKSYCPWVNTLLIWGGLRGGLAIALAMALPRSPSSDLILTLTFAVVAFAVIVQGLTTPWLVKRSKA